jgi:hypothetical protein
MEAGSLSQFVKKLRATDEVAVEVTGNTRLFHDAVAPHVARIAVVNTNQFRGITQSMKRADADTALDPASRNPVVRFQPRRPLPRRGSRTVLGVKGRLRRGQLRRALGSSALFATSRIRDGWLRREPDVAQFLRLTERRPDGSRQTS